MTHDEHIDQASPEQPDQLPQWDPAPEQPPHEQQQPSALRALLGPFVFVGLLALKFGKFAFVAIKGVKFLGTGISMVISIGAYALIFGLPFAIGFVLLLFVHELGHAIQLRREGIHAGAPVFIPFLGAAIAMKELPRDAAMEARVGIAGPILGTAGALVTHGAALALDSPLLMALAYTAYFLNLFNLVPVSPLDGGRIAAALSPKLWIGGLVLLAGLFLLRPNPVLLLIVILGGLDSWRRLREQRNADPNVTAYYESVSPAFRIGIGIAWLALVIGIVLLMQASFIPRTA
ncbi:MAG: site-2 protease family protein [Gaiellales bacterium]